MPPEPLGESLAARDPPARLGARRAARGVVLGMDVPSAQLEPLHPERHPLAGQERRAHRVRLILVGSCWHRSSSHNIVLVVDRAVLPYRKISGWLPSGMIS